MSANTYEAGWREAREAYEGAAEQHAINVAEREGWRRLLAPTLDEALANVEAALAATGEPWSVEFVRRGVLFPYPNPRTGYPVKYTHRYVAVAWHAFSGDDGIEAEADTAIGALQALAGMLR